MCRTTTILSLSGETLVPKSEDTSVEARLDITLLSLIVGLPLINRGGAEVHLTLVMWGGGNKLRWVGICDTSLNWDLSNRLGVIVMSLIAKIKQTMHKLGISLSL